MFRVTYFINSVCIDWRDANLWYVFESEFFRPFLLERSKKKVLGKERKCRFTKENILWLVGTYKPQRTNYRIRNFFDEITVHSGMKNVQGIDYFLIYGILSIIINEI